MYIGFWGGYLRGGAHLEDLDRGEDNIKMYPKDVSWGVARTGFVWLRMGPCGALMWMR